MVFELFLIIILKLGVIPELIVNIDNYKAIHYNKYMSKEKVVCNEALVMRIDSGINEAKLRSIARVLNKKVTGITLDNGKAPTVNLLDMVSYGITHPVKLRVIHEMLC